MKKLGKKDTRTILSFQRNEITEHHIYLGLAGAHRKGKNGGILKRIAEDELRHYRLWRKLSGKDVSPDRFKIWKFLLLGRLFGVTFCVKLMEGGEEGAQRKYAGFVSKVAGAGRIMADEARHERELVGMIDEERLRYIGSVVLGLNDALVELTGTLAGLTLALQNSKLIGTAGLITGIAASLSMAASEYLSTKTEDTGRDPFKASVYTGVTYTGAVAVLVLPYLLLADYMISAAVMFLGAVALIFIFTYYYSVVREVPFRARFLEMVGICLSVSAISFGIGIVVRTFLGIDV